MADLLSNYEDFKCLLATTAIPFVELGDKTLLIRNGDQLNIRQYHGDSCLSSWVDIETFKVMSRQLLGKEVKNDG